MSVWAWYVHVHNDICAYPNSCIPGISGWPAKNCCLFVSIPQLKPNCWVRRQHVQPSPCTSTHCCTCIQVQCYPPLQQLYSDFRGTNSEENQEKWNRSDFYFQNEKQQKTCHPTWWMFGSHANFTFSSICACWLRILNGQSCNHAGTLCLIIIVSGNWSHQFVDCLSCSLMAWDESIVMILALKDKLHMFREIDK